MDKKKRKEKRLINSLRRDVTGKAIRSDGVVSLFNGISTFAGYLISKTSFINHSKGDNIFCASLKAINQKVSFINVLEFKLAYDDAAVHYVSHYATGTLLITK